MNNTPQPAQNSYGSHEIDLFELLQTLWQEKLLIIFITFICTASAAIYAFTAQPQYSIYMTLKPAPLSLYGELVAGMKGDKQNDIMLGRSTVEAVLTQLKMNLELQANKVKYLTGKDIVKLQVNSKSSKNTDNAESTQQVTLVLNILQPEGAAQILYSYLDSVSELTLKELNSFVLGLGNTSLISKEMLYTVDSESNKAYQVKPKKSLIIAIGIVFGGMLGMFIAMVRKRKALKFSGKSGF